MADLFAVATGEDQIVGHADWVEIQSMRKRDRTVSREDLVSSLRIVGRKEAQARDLASQAFEELEDRVRILSTSGRPSISEYPFELARGNQVLRFKKRRRSSGPLGLLYLFLLSITRHSMDSRYRKFVGLDPTRIFERLCADALLEFWGGESPNSCFLRIGTARDGHGSIKFEDEVSRLCTSLNEGGIYKTSTKSPGSGDGGLDVAVWRGFSDQRRGGLVGFAQCKTGVNWRNELGKLRPRGFCGLYMTDPLILDPISIYMVPNRISRDRWESDMRDSDALLFDRCRIVQYGTALTRDATRDADAWLKAALGKAKISI